ncbi:MAG: zinc ribbon domain-containing protein [Planctomycetota bacterium]
MPTYDYVCDACDHAFEEFQMMSAKPLKKCEKCGKNKLRRLIGTGAGIIFKGSGFYETDYRSEGYNKDKKADSEKKPETKAEKKPDKKSEAKPKAESPKPKKESKQD